MGHSKHTQQNAVSNGNASIVEDNLGIIAQRVYRYWRCLPVSVKAHYDLEDMIQEVALHVVKATGSYQADKAKTSTFVYHVTDNKCQIILSHYRTAKRSADVVPIEGTVMQFSHPGAESTVQLREAKNAVERVIEYASEPLRAWLSKWLYSDAPPRPTAPVRIELKALAFSHGAGFHDFQLVLRNLVA